MSLASVPVRAQFGYLSRSSGTNVDAGTERSRHSLFSYQGLLLNAIYGKQGERPVANEQRKKQSDQQQSGQNRPPGQGQKQQNKSEIQRKAEEAARKDMPKPGDATSVGDIGT